MRTFAGKMLDRFRFEARLSTDDGLGNPQSGPWTEQFTRWAEVKAERGNESVEAARLEGQQRVRIMVHNDSGTRRITTDWRAVDARSGTVYAITSVMDEERRGQFITMEAISGRAP